MKRMTTLLGALVLALWFGAGQAAADEGGGAAQAAGQSAPSGQMADAKGGAYQAGPTNGASSTRVLSPGNDGAVSQSNTTTAAAIAANANKTSQDTTQSQTGGTPGSDYAQIAGQEAKNKQDANADATAVQKAPSNDAQSIRVLSPGNGGDLTQSNSATAGAAALNGNETDQSTDQSQNGSGYGSDSTQVAGQAASNDQSADADATAVQVKPSNTASSIRVLSPGNDGDVSQSNDATAIGIAANGNKTDQSIDQSQGGATPAYGEARKPDEKSGYGSDSTQVAGQAASNKQDANADATAVQVKPSNTASSIRVLSPGDGGNVSQSNSTTAVAAALNGNKTDQSIDQSQSGGSKSGYDDGGKVDGKSGKGSASTQVAGQAASNDQSADADATAVQVKPSNTASSIRVLSPGNDGDVSQSNDATAIGIAANGNKTDQSIDQEQSGSGQGSDYTQIAGQEASNKQDADADATAVQVKPSNSNQSIRVLSPGNDGDVSQSNNATALGIAANGNETDQSIDQSQGGHSSAPSDARKPDEKSGYGSDKGSDYTQVAGQEASNKQDADADATAVQLKPSNSNQSIRVLSPGNDGKVTQSNSTTAVAAALNANKTDQSIDQSQTGGGHGGSYLQVAGQGAWSKQDADAGAAAFQFGASNENTPIREGSPGGGGSVEQSNEVTALAAALNLNETCQRLMQSQTGYGSDSLQVSGQGSWDDQRGGAWSRAIQGGKKKKQKR